jgi:hypothetical protein
MAKDKKPRKVPMSPRANRMKLTREESLKRADDFPKRREQFIAAIRKGKDRGLSA